MPRSRPDLAERNRQNTRHGHARDEGDGTSPTWRSWRAMMQRSHFGSCDADRYLHRGILVCDRWQAFEGFLADMGERPAGTTLDRVDNEKGYAPDNCRWATASQQARNRSSSRTLTAFGRTQNVCEWEREFGISHQALRHRLRTGMTVEDALSRPMAPRRDRQPKERT